MKTTISTSQAPAAIGPYSQAVTLNGTLFVSGQLPIDPATGEMPQTVAEQTRRALQNIKAILAAAGMETSDIVKTTVLLTDMNDFAAMNEAYAEFFSDSKPARVCCAVAALPKGAKVEIDCIAGK
jgi:2-iminobutanoate/2-iminopropanoate deaminase